MLMGWRGWALLRAIQWESVLLRRLLCPLLKHSVPQDSVVAALQHGMMLRLESRPWQEAEEHNSWEKSHQEVQVSKTQPGLLSLNRKPELTHSAALICQHAAFVVGQSQQSNLLLLFLVLTSF